MAYRRDDKEFRAQMAMLADLRKYGKQDDDDTLALNAEHIIVENQLNVAAWVLTAIFWGLVFGTIYIVVRFL